MKKWILAFIGRIGDLIIKMTSVKGMFAIGMTVIAVLNKGQDGTLFWTGMAWGLLIGFREVQKFYVMMKTGISTQVLTQTPVVEVGGEGK